MPTATHALWALKEMNLEHETPHLVELLDNDFSWWTKFYPPSDVLHPQEWKQRINQKVLQYVEIMDEPYAIESLNLYDE